MSVAAWECLHRAARELARATALKQRLTDAWSRHLEDLSVAEMPGELRQDFESLRLALTRVPPLQGETAVAATVRKMSIGEADDCAQRIVALLDALHRTTAAPVRAGGQSQARAPADVKSPTVRVPTLISVNRV